MLGAGVVEILIPEQKTNRDGRDENKTGSDHFLRQGGALRMGRALNIGVQFYVKDSIH